MNPRKSGSTPPVKGATVTPTASTSAKRREPSGAQPSKPPGILVQVSGNDTARINGAALPHDVNGALRKKSASKDASQKTTAAVKIKASGARDPAATQSGTPSAASENDMAPDRPSGENEAEYEGHETWTRRRWAWEFLIRNKDFRAACESVGSEDADRRSEIAEEFGLKRFKSYREPYGRAVGKRLVDRPVFLPSAISVKSNVDPKNGKGRKVKHTLKYGQVVVLFNLADAATNQSALSGQIDVASRSLERRQRRFQKAAGGAQAPKRNPQAIHFLVSLRILDLRANGKSRVDALRIANSDSSHSDSMDVHDQKGKQIKGAEELAEYGYLHIASRSSAKPKKSKPQEQGVVQ